MTDRPGRIERDALQPVLCVVGEEVAPLERRRVLRARVEEAAHDRGVTTRVGVPVDGARRPRRTTRPTVAERPTVVPALHDQVDLLDRGSGRVASDVADIQPSRPRLERHAVRVAHAVRPDLILVRAVPVDERVVRRNRPVGIDAEDLPVVARERLRVRRLSVVTRRDMRASHQGRMRATLRDASRSSWGCRPARAPPRSRLKLCSRSAAAVNRETRVPERSCSDVPCS